MAKKRSKDGTVPDAFPERLRQLRSSENLSQEEFGKLARLHCTHIGRYERGLSNPSAEKLQTVADTLNVSGDYLMNGETEGFAKAHFKDLDLLNMFQEVESFNPEDKAAVKNLLEAFILKQKIRKMA